MKTQRKFTVVIERDEDGYYVASVPTLRGCHTQAKNLDTLMKPFGRSWNSAWKITGSRHRLS
ncbi:MAG: type II toxin-antitoxin system HicB family antitoxin [Terriglobales bacterium]